MYVVLKRDKEVMARESSDVGIHVIHHCPFASTMSWPILALHLRRTIWARTYCKPLTHTVITSGMALM
jgi:hypothetical protein